MSINGTHSSFNRCEIIASPVVELIKGFFTIPMNKHTTIQVILFDPVGIDCNHKVVTKPFLF